MLIDIFDLNKKNKKSHDFFKKVMIFASPGKSTDAGNLYGSRGSELKHLKYEDRLKKLEIYHLSARRLRGDLIETYKLLNNFTDVPFERFFRKSSYLSTRCANSCKLEKPSFTKGLQCRVNFFSYRVINAWNKLPEHVISSKSVNAFKSNLDRYWCKIRYGFSQA